MIGVVLLNYMAYKETFECVASLKKSLSGEIHIVIVDNHSSNNSYDILKNQYVNDKDITVIDSGGNIGFAKGNNVGYKYLKNNFDCDFIIVMNNDMVIEQSDFVEKIYYLYKKHNFHVLGPDIFSTRDNRHQNPEAKNNYTLKELKKIYLKLCIKNMLSFMFYVKWFLFGLFKIKKIEHKKDSDYLNEQFGVIMHGSCYIFSKLFINSEDECFYDKTFMYFESYILSYLCNKKGYKTLYSPELLVYHHEDASTDFVYKKKSKKAIFGNKCLKQSCREFIKLIK